MPNQNTYGAASKVNSCELSLDWQMPPKTKLCTFAQVAALKSVEVWAEKRPQDRYM